MFAPECGWRESLAVWRCGRVPSLSVSLSVQPGEHAGWAWIVGRWQDRSAVRGLGDLRGHWVGCCHFPEKELWPGRE